MKTIFDSHTLGELHARIGQLSSEKQAQWGKMDAGQMVKHCILSEEMFQGKTAYKRLLVGRLFGPMALKSILKNEKPMKRNQPTHPEFKIKDSGNLEQRKQAWMSLLEEYGNSRSTRFTGFVHPFFGKMNATQIGQYVYKHTDHHLRQFGV